MRLRKIHCIINPVAGKGRVKRKWPSIHRVLQENGIEAEAYFTTGRNDALAYSRELSRQKAALVIGVGGDGTLREIANGIAGTRTALAVIPCGSGNDFARTLGLPLDPLAAAALIPGMRRQTIDLGRVNDAYYLTVMGAGFDGETAKVKNSNRTFLSGTMVYLAAAAKVFFYLRASRNENQN